jgi:accessory gene regulator B
MIESISERVSNYLYRNNEKQDVSREVMKFALIGILTNGIIILLTLLIGYLVGKFPEICLSLASMAVLRFLAGGHHLSPPILCIVLSTAAVTMVPYIPTNQTLTYVFTAASLLLVWFFAPADLETKTRISKRTLLIMKYSALLLVAANLLILSHIIATALLISSVTLIPFKEVTRNE